MKRTDVGKFRNHWVGPQGLVHAPRDGGRVIQPRVWRSYAHCKDCRQEGGLVDNESDKIKVVVCYSALDIF